jgi:hypothetical protein
MAITPARGIRFPEKIVGDLKKLKEGCSKRQISVLRNVCCYHLASEAGL